VEKETAGSAPAVLVFIFCFFADTLDPIPDTLSSQSVNTAEA
jgi:hypothetical protein